MEEESPVQVALKPVEEEKKEKKTPTKCSACNDALISPAESSCCGEVCCQNCWRLVLSSNQNACPYCKAANPVVKATGASVLLQCPIKLCQETQFPNEYIAHVTSDCDQIIVRCLFCKVYMTSTKYIDHCQTSHSQELLTALIEALPQTQKELEQLELIYNSGAPKIEIEESYMNDRGFVSRFGTTGKLYCGQQLEVHGCGCDGYCGPSNGCSCLSCMRLNLKIRGALGSRCLINNGGQLAKVGENNVLYCGKRLSRNTDRYCCPREQCGNCGYVMRHNMVNKYSSFLN